jgi:hypothetical protein
MKRCSQGEPDRQRDPFGLGEVAGESRNKFHDQQKESNEDPEKGNRAGAKIALDEKEREACG